MDWSELGASFDLLAGKSLPERVLELEAIRLRDAELARELFSLLKAHDSAEGFIEKKMQRIFSSLAPGLTQLEIGERLLQFEIMEFLGEGSLAKVYLARDLELGRLVALKVTLSQSQEARTLAHFSLDGIVQVYSEHLVERDGLNLRVICLQFIAGPTLEKVAGQLDSKRSLVQILESINPRKVALEPAALKWRERLAALDLREAVILLGIRLAEILGHAHDSGVLHLDIKPANILIDPYGRPYLSDFNVSTYAVRLASGDLQNMGGTPHYMSPEQTRFFQTGCATELDARSDVFALGIVLSDLLKQNSNERLRKILARATHPDRDQRTASAQELAKNLTAWLRRHLTDQEMPRLWQGFHWILNYPLLAVMSLVLASQGVASFINISYNRLQILSALSDEQNRIFLQCVCYYNLLTYPLTILFTVLSLRELLKKHPDSVRARRSALRIPTVMFLAISLGWLPGAYIFPRVIEHFAAPVPVGIYWQFAFSFSLAWLTSMTTSLAVSVLVVARSLYPKYWQGQSELAAQELGGCERLNCWLTAAAALVPLSGVLLVLLTAPLEYSGPEYHAFKILLLVTVGFGLLNLVLVQRLSQFVNSVFTTLKRPRPLD